MTRFAPALLRLLLHAVACLAFLSCIAANSTAQIAPSERTFTAPKAAIEKALKRLQPAMSGHLPSLEGFALVGDHPLTRYQRAFYQCSAQVTALPSGATLVRISAKVTAWYSDSTASRSGYQLLNSNGRLESDLLDQLADQLSSASDAASAGSPSLSPVQPPPNEPTLSAPMPATPGHAGPLASSAGPASPVSTLPPPSLADAKQPDKTTTDLQTEVATLEDVLKNQARPKNIVAVKKSGTPVVESPHLGSKTLFMASAQDEFEMLDFNGDWVHVRISGLSRGWIWRTSLEMPEGIPDVPPAAAAAPTAADLFLVSREETAPFPGDWNPLRGKDVKIISVQKIRENEQGSGASAKLEYAKSLLDKNYEQLAKSSDLAGLVLIFDSADGGMMAATTSTIRRWKAGSLTDAALWHQCYFDPPETFSLTTPAATH